MSGRLSTSRLLLILAAILFLLAALVAAGAKLLGLDVEVLALLAFASWALSGAL